MLVQAVYSLLVLLLLAFYQSAEPPDGVAECCGVLQLLACEHAGGEGVLCSSQRWLGEWQQKPVRKRSMSTRFEGACFLPKC